MPEEHKFLAKIESTSLGTKDHGVLTFWLYFDFGGSGQGFGGYVLDTPVNPGTASFERKGTAFGCQCILKILETVGVEDWSELTGKEMWVYRDGPEYTGKIIGMEAPKYRKTAKGQFFIADLVKEYFPEDKTEHA